MGWARSWGPLRPKRSPCSRGGPLPGIKFRSPDRSFDRFFLRQNFVFLLQDQTRLGVKIKTLEHSREDNNGITLIPENNTSYKLQADEGLVVLAEDES